MKIKLTESQLEQIIKQTIKEESNTQKDEVLDFIFKSVKDLMKKGGKDSSSISIDKKSEDSKDSEDSGNFFGNISSDFKKMTDLVIDKLEGGYYNPSWHKTSGMGRSGETMFGIDRKHGGSLNTSPAGIEFWDTIDKNKTKNSWKHYFRGGNLEQKLKNLVVKIMEPHFHDLFEKYLSPESKKIVKKSNGLLFHFIYASWNGSGFFQKFAEAFNNEVDKGTTSIPELKKVAIQSRRNSAVSSSASKIENIMNNLS